jgi:acetylcholinesterase
MVSMHVLQVLLLYTDCTPAFGFLAGQEVKDAGVGNLGLQDRAFPHNPLHMILISLKCRLERLALHWVQKYICAFGGDPKKVTM